MTDPAPPPGVDTSVAHVARVYDYMLGGTNNYEVDRKAAEASAAPMGGMPAVRFSTRSNRAFLGRVVRRLALEADIRQFLDIGSGLPTEQNVHQVAQRHAPDASIVYVDRDPMVLSHANQLLGSTPQGATAFINGDLRDAGNILLRAEATLDFSRPIAVLMFTILHNLLDSEDPWAVVAGLVDAVPAGSYLAISHLTADFHPEQMAKGKESLDRDMREPFIVRSRDDIARLFAGLRLIEPGLVNINAWHPDDGIPAAPFEGVVPPIYGALAQKV